MHWQDLVLSVGNFIFFVALIPSILSASKPAFATSFLTGVVLLIFGIVYISLHLWLSTIMVLLSGAAWLTLAAQKYLQIKRQAKQVG